jgi:hypothetical protein
MQAPHSLIPPKLSESNRLGWRQWLIHNTLYPKLLLARR